MIWKRHPTIATMMTEGMNVRATPTFSAVGACSDRLQCVGFNPPNREELAKGEQPPKENVESEGDRNIPTNWQKFSTRTVEKAFFSTEIRPQSTQPEVALWKSQHGPLESEPFVGFPTCPILPAVANVAVYRLPWPSSCSVRGSRGVGRTDFQWRKPQHKCVGKAEAAFQPM